MSVTNNATLIEDMEGAGPTLTNIGGGVSATINTDIFIAGSQSAGRRADNQPADFGFWANPGATSNLTGKHLKVYAWVTHYVVITSLKFRIGDLQTDYEVHTMDIDEYPPLGGWWPLWLEVGQGSDVGSPDFSVADEFGITITIADVGGAAQNLIMDQIHFAARPVMTWDGSTGTFADFLATDVANALGALLRLNGVFFLHANLQIGSASATVFTESGVVVIAPESSHLPSDSTWLGIDIDLSHASTVISWTNSVFGAADPINAVRRPDLLVTGTSGLADFSRDRLDGLRAVQFNSQVTMNDGVIANSGQVDLTAAGSVGADISGTSVLGSIVAADEGALLWDVDCDPDGYLDDTSHTKGTNAHHAIEFGVNTPTTITLRGWTTSGFNASNGQNDSTFYVARTTGDVTINIIGGSGNFSYKSAGASVLVVIDPVTTKVIVKDETGAFEEGVLVLVEAGDGSGDLPFEESVSITRSGSTATVSHTAHGMSNGDKVCIRGADQTEYNGVFEITNVSTNAYDYTVSGTPDSPATGSITATGVVAYGTTNSSGEVTGTRAFTTDQNVRGVARKATTPPYYKPVSFTDTVDSAIGLTKSVQLQLDQ